MTEVYTSSVLVNGVLFIRQKSIFKSLKIHALCIMQLSTELNDKQKDTK